MKTNKGDIWKYYGTKETVNYLFVELNNKNFNKGEEYWSVVNLNNGTSENIYWWPNHRFYRKVA